MWVIAACMYYPIRSVEAVALAVCPNNEGLLWRLLFLQIHLMMLVMQKSLTAAFNESSVTHFLVSSIIVQSLFLWCELVIKWREENLCLSEGPCLFLQDVREYVAAYFGSLIKIVTPVQVLVWRQSLLSWREPAFVVVLFCGNPF